MKILEKSDMRTRKRPRLMGVVITRHYSVGRTLGVCCMRICQVGRFSDQLHKTAQQAAPTLKRRKREISDGRCQEMLKGFWLRLREKESYGQS